jgi:glyoxylase-like metal-dependent hydrolase (beta-lactamase superfamily II)
MSHVKLVQFSLVAFILTGVVASAAAQSATRPLTMKQLKPNVWVGLGGAGGNTTVIVGDTSVIVVDAKQTEAGAKALLAEIAKITPKPVKTVILTNSDADHVNGIAAFPPNLRIIAHLDAKAELQAAQKAGGSGAPPAGRLPTEIVGFYDMGQGMGKEESKPDTIDGVKVEMCHWSSAHSGADLAVYLPGDKIIAIGDIVVTDRADDNPSISSEKHGTTLGWIDTIKALLRLDADTFITGHGDLVTKADLQRKLDATVARREKIAAMVKEGKTLAQIKAAMPDAPAPGAAVSGAAPAKGFVDMVFAELSLVNPV